MYIQLYIPTDESLEPNSPSLHPFHSKHLIVSIGTETYVTLPKGQLPPTVAASKMVQNKITGLPELPEGAEKGSLVPGGGHVLVSEFAGRS